MTLMEPVSVTWVGLAQNVILAAREAKIQSVQGTEDVSFLGGICPYVCVTKISMDLCKSITVRRVIGLSITSKHASVRKI